MGNLIISSADKVSLVIIIIALIAMVIMFLLEIRKRHCKICGDKVSSSEGEICGGCYADEMLAGRLPDRRKKDE